MNNRAMMKALNSRPITIYPIYKDYAHDVLDAGRASLNVALLLSQLFYWFSKSDKFWHTLEQIMDETHLTINEVKAAKKILKKCPFLDITLEGLPAKTYYSINWEAYQTEMEKVAPEANTDQLDGLLSANSVDDNQPAFLLEETNIKETIRSIPPARDNCDSGSSFELFWKTFPTRNGKKVGKKACKAWWTRHKPDGELVEKMIASIAAHRETKEWKQDNGQYIPNPTTWLNGHRWEDEIDTSNQTQDRSETGVNQRFAETQGEDGDAIEM